MRHDRKRTTSVRMNRRAVSVLMDNDDEDNRRHRNPMPEFRLNPVLAAVREEVQGSTSEINNQNDKTSIFGAGTNYQSKDSENEEAGLNDRSPDHKKRKRQL